MAYSVLDWISVLSKGDLIMKVELKNEKKVEKRRISERKQMGEERQRVDVIETQEFLVE